MVSQQKWRLWNKNKLFVQKYEQKEANPSRIIGGASCPPAEFVNHEGPVYDRDLVQSEETDGSENVNKCAQLYRPEL